MNIFEGSDSVPERTPKALQHVKDTIPGQQCDPNAYLFLFSGEQPHGK